MSGTAEFHRRANDLSERGLGFRCLRYLRAQIRRAANAGVMLADDPRVLRAYSRGWDAPHYLRLLRWRDQGSRPRVIYDIGANRGSWAEMCQSVFQPSEVFLFEPQADFEEKAMARRRPVTAKWRFITTALGDVAGTAELSVSHQRAASSLLSQCAGVPADVLGGNVVNSRTVPVARLDDLAREQAMALPDLVKMDVQGFESRVIAGGQTVLGAAHHLIVEAALRPVYKEQATLPGLMAEIGRLGFQMVDISDAFRSWPTGTLWHVDLWFERTGNTATSRASVGRTDRH